jgi:hypothetical protein
MNKVLALIKKKYCEGLFIKDPRVINEITFQHVSTNAKGNAVFLIQHPGQEALYYELEKVDLSGFSRMKSLSIPKQYRNDFDVNHSKAMISNWINRHTGHSLVEEDIAYLVPEKEHLCVVIAADSMRFKSTSFQLIRL